MITAQPYGFNVSFRTPAVAPPAPKPKSVTRVIAEHVSRHKAIYRIGAITLTMVFMGGFEALAEPLNVVGDSTGIDSAAEKIYTKLVRIGKWIIIIKGAFDTISHTVQGDFVSARKSGLSYMLVYVILLGLPWAFKQIEGLFDEVI